MLSRSRIAALTGVAVLGTSACADLLGLGSYTNLCGGGIDAPNVCMGGGGSSSSSASTGGSGGGSGGEGGCSPNLTEACYDGPGDSWKHGICKRGQHTCRADGSGFGTCEGQVLPKTETCANKSDEDCDGNECAMWAHLFGDAANQYVGGVAVDGGGNVFIAGTFQGTLAFDPQNPLTANGTQVYLAKFDASGHPLWSKAFASNGLYTVLGVATDSTGSVFVNGILGGVDAGGSEQGTINFGANPLSSLFAAYLAKFDASGAFQWNEKYEETVDDLESVQVRVDSSDRAVIAGTSYIGPSDTSVIWFAKYATDGTQQFVKRFTIQGDSYGLGALSITSFDDIVIAGRCGQHVNLGAGSVPANGFIASYSAGGSLQWSSLLTVAGGTATLTSADGDSAGNVVVAGKFTGTLTLAGGAPQSDGGSGATVMARLHQDGTTDWIHAYPGGGAATVAVKKVGGGDISLAAAVNAVISLGGPSLTPTGANDMVLAKLDGNGAYVWQRLFHGSGQSNSIRPFSLTTVGVGKTVMAQPVVSAIDVGTGTLTPAGGSDVLLAEFAP